MKKIDLYEIAVKLLGLYLVIVLIDQLKTTLTVALLSFKQGAARVQAPILMMLCVGLVLLAFFVWLLLFRTKSICRLISKPADRTEAIRLFAENKTIYAIALVLLGLITVVWTLPDLIVKLKNYISFVQANQFVNLHNKTFMLTAGIKIALGVLAIAYADPIARFLTPKEKASE